MHVHKGKPDGAWHQSSLLRIKLGVPEVWALRRPSFGDRLA